MSSEVRVCGEDESLLIAAKLMWEFDIGALPVLDADRRLVGMLTDRDVCMAAFHHDAHLSDLRVSEAMTTEVITIFPSDHLEVAERAMRDGQIRRLPVVNAHGELCGIVSLNDLARAAVRNGNGVAGLEEAAIVRTLAAISESVAPTHRATDSGEQAVNLSG